MASWDNVRKAMQENTANIDGKRVPKLQNESEDWYNPYAAALNGVGDLGKNILNTISGWAGSSYDTMRGTQEAFANEYGIPVDDSIKERVNEGADHNLFSALSRSTEDAANSIPELRESYTPTGAGRFATDLIRNAPQLVESAAAAYYGGAPAAVASGIANIYGSTYGDLRNKGYSRNAANVAGLVNTAFQEPFEYVGLASIMGKVPGLKKLVSKASQPAYSKIR